MLPILMPRINDAIFIETDNGLKNLFRKTAQYFLDTLHIWETAITP